MGDETDSSGVDVALEVSVEVFLLEEERGSSPVVDSPGVISGAGVGDAFRFFLGIGSASSDLFSALDDSADVFRLEPADFVGVAEAAETDRSLVSALLFSADFLCFRGGGVGVGAKTFFILWATDSSDLAAPALKHTATKQRIAAVFPNLDIVWKNSTPKPTGCRPSGQRPISELTKSS